MYSKRQLKREDLENLQIAPSLNNWEFTLVRIIKEKHKENDSNYKGVLIQNKIWN